MLGVLLNTRYQPSDGRAISRLNCSELRGSLDEQADHVKFVVEIRIPSREKIFAEKYHRYFLSIFSVSEQKSWYDSSIFSVFFVTDRKYQVYTEVIPSKSHVHTKYI